MYGSNNEITLSSFYGNDCGYIYYVLDPELGATRTKVLVRVVSNLIPGFLTRGVILLACLGRVTLNLN